MKTCRQKLSRETIDRINQEYNDLRSRNKVIELNSLRLRLHYYLINWYTLPYEIHLRKKVSEKSNQPIFKRKNIKRKTKPLGRLFSPIVVTLFSESVSFIDGIHYDAISESDFVQSFENRIRKELGLLRK